MEAMVKKYQQKFRKVREEMERWDQLQSRLVSQFRNVSSIIERLQVIKESKNYGTLNNVNGIKEAVLTKQMESMENIIQSMSRTLEEFHCIVLTIEKMHRDGSQLIKGGTNQLTKKQLQQRVGIKPCLAYCLDSLQRLHNMHLSEYRLKSSLISALLALVWKPSPSSSDLGALQQLLVDQPNIPKEEVQETFDIVFAGENC